jgi:hypothetical protein
LAALVLVMGSAALRARDVITIVSPRAAAVTGFAVLALLAVGWAFHSGRLPRRALAPAAVALLAVGVGLGYEAQRTYLDGRYATRAGGNPEDSAFMWARDRRDTRIATVIARQYPLFGLDLSNRVDYVGVQGEDAAFKQLKSCAGWREAINRGGYEYIVTGFREPAEEIGKRPPQPPEALWTRGDPGVREIVRDEDVSVFELRGRMHPELCGRRS